MKLEELLRTDQEAAALFNDLPLPIQKIIRRKGKDIDTLAALRDYTINMVHQEGPFYANGVVDGTELDPELKAQWTREHQT